MNSYSNRSEKVGITLFQEQIPLLFFPLLVGVAVLSKRLGDALLKCLLETVPFILIDLLQCNDTPSHSSIDLAP